jgi:phage terminase large subunit
MARKVIIPYAPRAAFLPYHNRTARWSVLVAHRRAGKTVACVNDLIRAAITCPRPDGRYAYIAPLFNQAKDVAWTYLKQYAEPILAGSPNESELRVDLVNGARIRLYGADNPDRLRGLYLDGVVLDEYADMHPAVWGSVVRPALSDRQGWATFIGTPKGRNSFYELIYGNPSLGWVGAIEHPDWFYTILRASETGIVPPHELEDMRQTMTPEEYEQEAECSFDAAIKGAYFGKEIANAERDGRICDVPYEPSLPVHTAWDLGVGDSTAIWFFQIAGGEIRVIDHYENSGHGLGHYASVLSAREYTYGTDFVPHDARVKELGTGRTRVETLLGLGRRPTVIPLASVEDGINAARLTLQRCWFDRTKCAQGLEALRQYRADYDEKARVFKNAPKHDWTSHTADAFRYLALAWREIAPSVVKPKPKTQLIYEVQEDGVVRSNMGIRELVELKMRRKRLED